MCSPIHTFRCLLQSPQWYPECLMIVVKDYLCQFKFWQFRGHSFMCSVKPFFELLETLITRFKLKQEPNIQNSPVTTMSVLAKVFLITWVNCSFIHTILWSIFLHIPLSISSISPLMHFVSFFTPSISFCILIITSKTYKTVAEFSPLKRQTGKL